MDNPAIEMIKIEKIWIGDRMREVDSKKVKELADSIKEIGLLHPVVLDRNYNLIAGAHRIEAFKLLGYDEINCFITDLKGLKAQLAQIDENLIKNELSTIERAEHLERRKEIYEAIHPETKAGVAGGKASGISRGTNPESGFVQKKSFIDDTAEKTGRSRSVISEEIKIAKDIIPAVKEELKKRDIPKTDLVRISRIPKPEQKEILEVLKTQDNQQLKEYLNKKEDKPVKQPDKQKNIIQKELDETGFPKVVPIRPPQKDIFSISLFEEIATSFIIAINPLAYGAEIFKEMSGSDKQIYLDKFNEIRRWLDAAETEIKKTI